MAAKKAPAKKAPAKKVSSPKKPASAADFRMKEEADKKKAKRTDFAGTQGFGDTTKSFFDSNDGHKAFKSAENYLKSKGVNPDKYTSSTGKNKGQSPKWDMYNAGNPSMSSPLSKAWWTQSDGGRVVNGIPRFQKDSVAKDAYKRVTAEIKLKAAEIRGMNSKGKIVPNKKKK